MRAAWTQTRPPPTRGRHFRFADVYCEPKPYRPEGPRMWFGGQTLHPPLLRRIVRYGDGFHPFGTPTDADLQPPARARCRRPGATSPSSSSSAASAAASRAPTTSPTSTQALAAVPVQLARGFTSICFKPSMFTDDRDALGEVCAPGRPARPRRGRRRRLSRAAAAALNLAPQAPMLWERP